ncbi:MAG: transporter substrate-binding domain-containing protein [Sutterella wadsworthensis]
MPGVLKAENYGFAIRKGDDKLRARLDKALDEIRADGTYDKIYAKWFGGNK